MFVVHYKWLSLNSSSITDCLPKGFILGRVESHHAKFLSQSWFLEYPQHNREIFLFENISRYNSTAIFDIKQPRYPVAWQLFKAGGILGIRYTVKSHRRQNLSMVINSMAHWKILLCNNPGYSEVDDALLPIWKIEEKNILAKSMCIWNYPSLQELSLIS